MGDLEFDGVAAGKVTVSSTVGVNMPLPCRLTRHVTWADVVVALIVALAASPHLMSFEPARRHMWVVPCGLIALSWAMIVPGPSLTNVTKRGSPALEGTRGSSLRSVIVTCAIGTGVGDGVGGGLAVGASLDDADGSAEGDPLAPAIALGDPEPIAKLGETGEGDAPGPGR